MRRVSVPGPATPSAGRTTYWGGGSSTVCDNNGNVFARRESTCHAFCARVRERRIGGTEKRRPPRYALCFLGVNGCGYNTPPHLEALNKKHEYVRHFVAYLTMTCDGIRQTSSRSTVHTRGGGQSIGSGCPARPPSPPQAGGSALPSPGLPQPPPLSPPRRAPLCSVDTPFPCLTLPPPRSANVGARPLTPALEKPTRLLLFVAR